MLLHFRDRASITANDLANAGWERGVPLSIPDVCRAERAERHPTAWHLDVVLHVLGLSDDEATELVERWALHPRRRGQGITWSSWRQLLADEHLPVPVARLARPDRLHSPRRVDVSANLKLRLTADEDTLLRKSVSLFGVTVTDLVRDSVFAAIAQRRAFRPGRTQVGPKDRAHNLRIRLENEQLNGFRRIAANHDFAAWVRFIVLDDLEDGTAAARYRTVQPAA